MSNTKKNCKRMQWTKVQDKFLTSLVGPGEVNWAEIASKVNNEFQKVDRTGKM